jgi:quinol monooxygenase YgiN
MALIRDEVMPTVLAMDGCLGMSTIVDRESGRCISTTAWETEEAMRASAEAVLPLRRRGAEILGGEMTVAEWEIALLHRMHMSGDGACVRCSWVHAETHRIDGAIDMVRASMSDLDQVEGFCGASLFVNRGAGVAVISTSWRNRPALEATRDGVHMRQQSAREAGLDILEVAEFDLVMAHLRVPEMA